MTDGLLKNIILLEKDIQNKVAEERLLASEWRERELAVLSDLTAERCAEKERRLGRLAKKRVEIAREGAALEEVSSTWCRHLSNLDEAVLRDLLKRQLVVILPGGEQ